MQEYLRGDKTAPRRAKMNAKIFSAIFVMQTSREYFSFPSEIPVKTVE